MASPRRAYLPLLALCLVLHLHHAAAQQADERQLLRSSAPGCNLTGECPSYLPEMSELVWLDLSTNAFTGNIPPSIWNLTKLQVLYLHYNKLAGDVVIDGAIGAAGLIEIDLSYNKLTGVIPERFGTLTKLIKLCLSGNGFSGEIPASLAQLPSLNNGGLTGTLPETLFWNMTRLYIMNNKFRGSLPSSAAKLQKFNAGNNSFSGKIPARLAARTPLLPECSNILLDAELNAKVADFGLARMLVEAAGTTPTDTMSAVAGTFGYMAPECAYTRKANEKVDVYSFGVVLLELATGREAGNGGEHCSLAEQSDDFEVVFKLGIICTGAQPSTRPTMKDVLQILLRCEQAHRKTVDEKTAVSEYDAAPLLPAVRGGSRRKQLSDAADGKGSFDDVV
uniref:Receptor protein kinase CLAVATA1 n=1 Tax=Aegilops tauschii TaxID=37682 RepID=M8C195_AEGTA